MWVMRVKALYRWEGSARDWYCHHLKDDIVSPIILDLVTDNNIDTSTDLTGKVFDIEYTSPFISIAHGLKEVTE
jgi:hypothetical protein